MNFEERFRECIGKRMQVNMGIPPFAFSHVGVLHSVENDWAEMRWPMPEGEGSVQIDRVVFRLSQVASFHVFPRQS